VIWLSQACSVEDITSGTLRLSRGTEGFLRVGMQGNEENTMRLVRTCKVMRAALALTVLVMAAGAISLTGCQQKTEDSGDKGGFVMRDTSNCLPNITLIDQRGDKVSLASLKGKPVLFDFIYTTCPGPCLLLTAHMKRIAEQFGPALGKEAHIVSITVDPEHDHPAQLLAYANDEGANISGWLFLTGTAPQIDEVMKRFDMVRQREADGTIDHVLEFFLVGPDGRGLLQYLGDKADPERVVSDIERAATAGTVAASESIPGYAKRTPMPVMLRRSGMSHLHGADV
jgi:protein SCO1